MRKTNVISVLVLAVVFSGQVCLVSAGGESTAPSPQPDPRWPIYHLMAPRGGGVGDVNGPIYHQGNYHVFYQYLPDRSANPKDYCWGHARSKDLIGWQHLPVALRPATDKGEQACHSGGTFITRSGLPMIFYSSWSSQQPREVWAAMGDKDLITWTRYPDNPLLPLALHEGVVKIHKWRDPFVFTHQNDTYIISGGSERLGAAVEEHRGIVSLYRAENDELMKWKYVGPLFYHPDSPDNACPNFFQVGDKWVLLMSRHRPHVEDWFVGTWDQDTLQFEPETSGILAYNEATYATQGLYHADGRVVIWNTIHTWRRENRPTDWPGSLSLPRVISVSEDNRLRVEPLAELSQLRGGHFHAENIALNDAGKVLKEVEGDALEIHVTIEPKDAESFGITVRRSHDGTRGIELRYGDTFYVDGEAAMHSLKHGRENDPVRKPFALSDGEPLELKIFIDKAVLEVFVNNRICYDRIIHACDQTGKALALPQLEDLGIELFANGGEATVKSIDVWEMNPITLTTHQ